MTPETFEKNIKQYLCPPGNGVYTVNTAKERKAGLHQELFQATGDDVQQKWEESLNQLKDSKLPLLLGISSDCGGGILRGANWGPLFLRNQLVANKEHNRYFDIGDIRVIPHLLMDHLVSDQTINNCKNALYNDSKSSLPVSPLSIAESFASDLHQTYPDKKVIYLGGDHSVSYPIVKEFLKAKKAQGKKIAIIHFDAHTDLLKERLGVDICFGSWAYHILPYLDKPSHLLQFGIRSSGKDKSYWESQFGVQQFWADDFKQQGYEKITQTTLDYLEQEQIDEVYVSFDIDALDSSYASATGTPEENGLAPHECIGLLKEVLRKFKLGGADLVEVAPFIKSELKGQNPEPDSTLLVSAQILMTFLDFME